MTIDEAIDHCLDVARERESAAHTSELTDEGLVVTTDLECESCADEHRQLADWLLELKHYKAVHKDMMTRLHKTKQSFSQPKDSIDRALQCGFDLALEIVEDSWEV